MYTSFGCTRAHRKVAETPRHGSGSVSLQISSISSYRRERQVCEDVHADRELDRFSVVSSAMNRTFCTADGAERSSRVFDKAQVMQHANRLLLEIALGRRKKSIAGRVLLFRRRKRVDRKVAALKVLLERRRLHLRQRGRRFVVLGAGGPNVELEIPLMTAAVPKRSCTHFRTDAIAELTLKGDGHRPRSRGQGRDRHAAACRATHPPNSRRRSRDRPRPILH